MIKILLITDTCNISYILCQQNAKGGMDRWGTRGTRAPTYQPRKCLGRVQRRKCPHHIFSSKINAWACSEIDQSPLTKSIHTSSSKINNSDMKFRLSSIKSLNTSLNKSFQLQARAYACVCVCARARVCACVYAWVLARVCTNGTQSPVTGPVVAGNHRLCAANW